jgi:broad specificity phosphatase PhoE
MSEKTFYLCRHGESEYNKEHRIGGNSNLSERGNIFADKLFDYLKNKNLNVYTSKLKRTIHTAGKFSNAKQFEIINEIDAGDMENLTFEEFKNNFPDEYNNRKNDKLNYTYPNGESYLDLEERVVKVLDEIHTYNNLIVCHRAVLRVLYNHLLDKPSDKNEMPYIDIPLHHVFHIKETKDKKYKLIEIINLN